jgi:hypothetical protein
LKVGDETQRETALKRITKAATVLGGLGKRIADDAEVRKVLLSAATEQLGDKQKWHELQMRLAAIDALGKINEHRGAILTNKRLDENELTEGKNAAAEVERIAAELFDKLGNKKEEGLPSAHEALKALIQSQPKIIKIAERINAQAPLSMTERAAVLSRLTDAETLEASAKKIYFSYLEATKKRGVEDKELIPTGMEDKTVWQKKNEAAYDMWIEAKLLSHQVNSLGTDITNLAKDRAKISELVSTLTEISKTSQLATEKPELDRSKAAYSDQVTAEVAIALTRIFSTPAVHTPPADAAKKDEAKKDGTKKKK